MKEETVQKIFDAIWDMYINHDIETFEFYLTDPGVVENMVERCGGVQSVMFFGAYAQGRVRKIRYIMDNNYYLVITYERPSVLLEILDSEGIIIYSSKLSQ